MIDEDNDAYQRLSQQNAQLKTDLETREHQLDVISRIVRDISTSLDIDTVLSQVAEQARKLINAETVAVPIINEEQNVYTYKAVSGNNAKKILQHQRRNPAHPRLLFSEGLPYFLCVEGFRKWLLFYYHSYLYVSVAALQFC